MPALSLYSPVTSIPLIGPSAHLKLRRLNITTVGDLLHHYPVKYLDRTTTTPISQLEPDTTATIKAQILDFKQIYTRTGKTLQQANVIDNQGDSLQLTWFNQPYLKTTLKPATWFAFSGKVKLFRNRLTLQSPDWEILSTPSTQLHTGRLVAVYDQTAGVSSKWLRSRIKAALSLTDISDHFPPSIIDNYSLQTLNSALTQIHFPDSSATLDSARHRLAFDELFFLQLQGTLKRRDWHQKQARPIPINTKKITTYLNSLPFQLTSGQHQAYTEILSDLSKPTPMNRLLEGDVGSGKTVVASIALVANHLAGYSALVMAPTEILARQLYDSFTSLLQHLPISIGLYTSKTKSTQSDIMVGTHALLFNPAISDNLNLVIIDEQHRFGVKQRAKLESFTQNPHRLTMSATPIPRTVALTLYGDLDVSIIDQLPQNRLPIKTWVVPPAKRTSAYRWISDQITKHKTQVYVICPRIDEGGILDNSDVKSVTAEYDHLKQVFPKLKIGMLHGKLSSENKTKVLNDFRSNLIHLLVSTTVVEVGIDVPNATIILIESAERFGLAQLHQLRGRVGRGELQSYCLLFNSSATTQESQRLTYMTKTNSGFKLAEYDLKLRGPGEVFGQEQHGFSQLKLASLSNRQLVHATKQAVHQLLDEFPNLDQLPAITDRLTQSDPLITNN